MNHTDKYSQHIWIIWPVWLNGWVILYKLSGSGFESWCILHTRYCANFEQGGPWHSGNYRQYIHSDTHMWNDKNKLSVNSITVSFEKISSLISQIFIIIFASFQEIDLSHPLLRSLDSFQCSSADNATTCTYNFLCLW